MISKDNQKSERFCVGIDIGSTTVKIVASIPKTGEIVYSDYRRHGARQVECVQQVLREFGMHFPNAEINLCMTGSGAKILAESIEVPFVQEVVANSIALRKEYKNIGTAIELGGQDAKIIFFKQNNDTGELQVSDMRMNGSCAGGTGAFIDEIAAILKIPVEEFDALAAKGNCVYDISGRCGVCRIW